MVHHYTKFGCIRLNWLVDKEKNAVFSESNLHCDLDLENGNLNFLHNTPVHDNVPSLTSLAAKGSTILKIWDKQRHSKDLNTHCENIHIFTIAV